MPRRKKKGDEAADAIEDPGPPNPKELMAARHLLDDHEVDRSLWLVRKLSNLRWEDAVSCRVGSRMGRPEKASRREMKPLVHSLFPIGDHGGPQRLLGEAAKRGEFELKLALEFVKNAAWSHRCYDVIIGRILLFLKSVEGRLVPGRLGNRTPRRLGQRTSIPVAGLLEVKRRSLGLDRLPEKIKSVKGLMSYEQTPEPFEKRHTESKK